MKKQLIWMPLILLAVLTSTVVSTNAQSGIRANVPFDFIVGDKTFHAGEILVMRQTHAEVTPMSITNSASAEYATRVAIRLVGLDASDKAKLVFRKYGDRYYLAQVWIAGFKPWELMKSSSERNEGVVAKNSRSGKFKPEVVSVVADML